MNILMLYNWFMSTLSHVPFEPQLLATTATPLHVDGVATHAYKMTCNKPYTVIQ